MSRSLVGCLLLSVFSILSACAAPLAGTPTALPLAAGRHVELGAETGWYGGVGNMTGKRDAKFFDHFGAFVWNAPVIGGHYRVQLGRLDIGGTGFISEVSSIGGGGFAHYRLYQSDRFAVAVGGQVGWLYAVPDVSVMGRVAPNLWVYATPNAGLRAIAPIDLALGAQYADHHVFAGIEGNMGGTPHYSALVLTFGASMGVQF
jgi:hypothetical protein